MKAIKEEKQKLTEIQKEYITTGSILTGVVIFCSFWIFPESTGYALGYLFGLVMALGSLIGIVYVISRAWKKGQS